MNQIVDVENQIMLWEKKIQLERETQEALDPDYGQPEIKGMKKEIHRMQLRLNQVCTVPRKRGGSGGVGHYLLVI